MNNTPIEKITLKCVVTGELITYRGWDYISKRIQKAGSLDALQKTFTSRKGAKLSNGNSAILMVKSMDTSAASKKPRQTKQQSVDSFVDPEKLKGKVENRSYGTVYAEIDGIGYCYKNGEVVSSHNYNNRKD